MFFDHKIIIASPDMFEFCKKRYKKRQIVSADEAKTGTYYYWNKKNKMRIVRNKNEIWTLGKEYPMIKRLR